MNKYVPYETLVLNLLEKNQYCRLQDHVIISIHYKEIVPASLCGKPYLRGQEEEIYSKENVPFKYIYLTGDTNYGYSYKMENLELENLKIECLNLKIDRNFINQCLNLNLFTFEEEIYTLIAHLNFDVTKVSRILGLTFEKCTRFIPVNFVLYARYYTSEFLQKQSAVKKYFGPSDDVLFQPRLIDGKISEAKVENTILSLRNARALYSRERLPVYVLKYLPYTIYFGKDSYIHLAYNPLENPLI